MLNKIYLTVAAAFAALLGWLKITQRQRDNARVEADKQAHARMAENAKHKQAASISQARVQANEEAKQVQSEAVNNRGKRPSGSFGDKRIM